MPSAKAARTELEDIAFVAEAPAKHVFDQIGRDRLKGPQIKF